MKSTDMEPSLTETATSMRIGVELDAVVVEVVDEPIGPLGEGARALRVIVSDRSSSSSKMAVR